MGLLQTSYRGIPNARVHSGFYSAYEAIADDVVKQMKIYVNKYPSASILITGHSLGGALATFAALDIKT